MSHTEVKLFFFAALPCEAKPIIAHYQLKKLDQPHPFSLYQSEDTALVISGTGKTAMAGAVAYSMAVFNHVPSPVIINIGIAGHSSHALGQLLLADKITDHTSPKKTFYPQWTGTDSIKRSALVTVSEADFDYPLDCMVDMEASAFYEMSIRFSSMELIHCLKTVSDNPQNPGNRINAKTVSGWIAQQLSSIEQIANYLLEQQQATSFETPVLFEQLLKEYHFTVSARIRLKALLHRWQIITDNSLLNLPNKKFNHAKLFLKWLEQQIDEREFSL